MSNRPDHIPAHWEAASVEELTEFVTSGSRGWAKYYSDDGPLFLRVGNLDHDTVYIDLSNIVHVTPPAGAEGKRTRVDPGDILLSITAEVGMVGLAKDALGEAYVNQHVALVRPLPGVWPPGLAYTFLDPQGLQAVAKKQQYGATKPGLSLIQVRGFQVGIPPLPEQHRIVEAIESYFTRLDDAEAPLERVQRNLKRYRASVLKAAVEGRLVPTEADLAQAEGRDYEPASVLLESILAERRRRWEEAELAKLIVQGRKPSDERWKKGYRDPATPDATSLQPLPQGWCWVTLDQLAYNTIDYRGKTPPGADQGIPIISAANVKGGQLRFDKPRFVSPETYESHAIRGFSKPGDLIVTTEAPVGEVALYPDTGTYLLTRRVIGFQTAHVENGYLTCCFHHVEAKRHLDANNRGTTVPRILKPALLATPFPLPPLAEQVRISREVERHRSITDAALRQAQVNAARCTRLRQAILKWAFEGKLADQNPNDEPASILLDRIKAEREAAAPPKKTKRRSRPRKKAGA